MKKGIFCHTESVAMTPKSHDHIPTTSLWGVAAKWATWALKTKLILCLRDPQGYSHISLSLSSKDFEIVQERHVSFESKPHAVFHGVCEITLTEVLATQMGVMQRSKKVSLFELYKFNPLSPHCRSIVLYLGSSVNCYSLQQQSRPA